MASDSFRGYRFVFELETFASLPIEEKLVILQKALETLCFANECYLRRNPNTPILYQSGVQYKPEPPGKDNWQDIPRCLSLKDTYGSDCEDLASWRVAELRVRLNEPQAKPHVIYRQMEDFTLFHIQVQRADGSIEDPSKHLGMR